MEPGDQLHAVPHAKSPHRQGLRRPEADFGRGVRHV